MEFFLKYLKSRALTLFIIAAGGIIFAVVFALYSLPVEAAIYPTALCLILCLIVGVCDYIFALRKHKSLSRLAAPPDEYPGKLGGGLFDEDYDAIIDGLYKKLGKLNTERKTREADMTDYYTTWAHQIKLPIASVKLTLEGEDSKAARSVSEDLFRIEQYVGMALTYLRLDSDSTDYLFGEYELDQIVRGEVKKFASQFIGRGIKLDYRPSGKKVVTDSKWLGFVIGQLISNALKYTPSGKVEIFCEDPAALVIRDSGIGIEKSDIPRVFERGYTGKNGRGESASSGLGLWLCKRVCDNLGCRLELESEPGVGTTVRVDLAKERGMFE